VIHVYTLRCVATGAIYVGKTRKPVARRFTEHKRDAMSGGTRPLHRALRRWKRWDVLEERTVPEAQADAVERYYLQAYDRAGYPLLNVAPAGGGGRGRVKPW
jgi:hypothetical protein